MNNDLMYIVEQECRYAHGNGMISVTNQYTCGNNMNAALLLANDLKVKKLPSEGEERCIIRIIVMTDEEFDRIMEV